ncbi:hypothetical protein EYY17_16985 [Escherichia coli]|nr:hypothetical protein EYY31_16865 [Escherichia coli]TIJ14998.1 hypothetical protein EYY17_16985 [Escherichia coli]
MSIKNDGHYFCRAGGNRPDGLNEPVTIQLNLSAIKMGVPSILLGLFNWIIAVFFVICLHAGFYGRSRSQFYT